MHLKVRLWMRAGGANLRSLCSYYDMTAVATFPYLNLALLEHFLSLNVVQKCTITLFVALLDGA